VHKKLEGTQPLAVLRLKLSGWLIALKASLPYQLQWLCLLRGLERGLIFLSSKGKTTKVEVMLHLETGMIPLYLGTNTIRKLSVWPGAMLGLMPWRYLEEELATCYFPLFFVCLRKR